MLDVGRESHGPKKRQHRHDADQGAPTLMSSSALLIDYYTVRIVCIQSIPCFPQSEKISNAFLRPAYESALRQKRSSEAFGVPLITNKLYTVESTANNVNGKKN